MLPQTESYLACALIFRKDGKFLLLKRSGTGFMDGYWALVGGKCDKGESITESALRESCEEVGVQLRADQVTFAHVMHRPDVDKHDWIIFYFVVDAWEGELINNEPKKHSEMAWFALDTLPEMMVVSHRKALEYIAHNSLFSELNGKII